MNYLDDNNENEIELPQFGPASNEAENDKPESQTIPNLDKKSILKELGIPVFDETKVNEFVVAGLSKENNYEWIATSDLESSENFGIVLNNMVLIKDLQFKEVVENFDVYTSMVQKDSQPGQGIYGHDLIAGAKRNILLASGDSVKIDNATLAVIKEDEADFNRLFSGKEYQELKLSQLTVHISPDTKETLKRLLDESGLDGEKIINDNIGEIYPKGLTRYALDDETNVSDEDYGYESPSEPFEPDEPIEPIEINETIEIEPVDQIHHNDSGVHSRQSYTMGGNGGAIPQQGETYRKNMAEIQNGVGNLAGGVASLVGGGAALTGVLAHKAGSFLKSLTTGLNNQFSAGREEARAQGASQGQMNQSEMTASPQAESEPVIAREQPLTYGLPAPSKSPDNFLFKQMEARREEYSRSISDFWAHEKIKPIKSQIEALARESGVSVSEMNQKVTHEPEYAYLRESIRHAVDADSELKDTLRTADSNFDEWIETYQVLKDKQERVVDPEAAEMLDNELENQRAQMEEAVSEAPPGEGMFSKLEELKMKLKEIVEKIREVISKWTSTNDNESGNSPAP